MIYTENIDFKRIFRFFKNRFFDEKSISWDGIWIAGRPRSRWDPPADPEKTPKTPKNIKIRKFGVGALEAF